MSDEAAREPDPTPPVFPRGAGMPIYNGRTCPKCGGKLMDCDPMARPPMINTVCPTCHTADVREA